VGQLEAPGADQLARPVDGGVGQSRRSPDGALRVQYQGATRPGPRGGQVNQQGGMGRPGHLRHHDRPAVHRQAEFEPVAAAPGGHDAHGVRQQQPPPPALAPPEAEAGRFPEQLVRDGDFLQSRGAGGRPGRRQLHHAFGLWEDFTEFGERTPSRHASRHQILPDRQLEPAGTLHAQAGVG